MKLETVYASFNAADALLVSSRLDAAGFENRTKNELTAMTLDGTAMASGGIQVQVPEDRAAEAREFLKSSAPSEE
ncbi:MAG: hypothetical protein JWN25_3576 [Verrucomicrobiales bacterium]|nr:hypothetical protein [Verrucomicrobiales bacterium]